MGFAFTSDLSAGGIEECVAAAQAMSAVTEADPDLRIASGATDRAELAIHEPIRDRTVVERAEAAFAAERAARGLDPRVIGFRKTSFFDGETTTILATTSGTHGSYSESWTGLSTSVIASEGEERQIGYHGHASRRGAEIDPEAIGRSEERRVGKGCRAGLA